MPVTDWLTERVISLPMHTELDEEQLIYYCKVLEYTANNFKFYIFNLKMYMKIAVVGTGYVGLVTGTCFAETGNDVTCVDIDAKKSRNLTNGEITIYEPGLEKLFLRNLKEERLNFTTDLAEGIKDAGIIFLALPTPPGEDGSADLQICIGCCEELGKIYDRDYKVIIDKSTVPVGTAEKVHAAIAKKL